MTLAEKPKLRPTDEPGPAKKVETLGEALDEIGFVPAYGAKRVINREDHYQEPLTRWRKPKEQD